MQIPKQSGQLLQYSARYAVVEQQLYFINLVLTNGPKFGSSAELSIPDKKGFLHLQSVVTLLASPSQHGKWQ